MVDLVGGGYAIKIRFWIDYKNILKFVGRQEEVIK